MKKKAPEKTVAATNRKAFHRFHILETFEAGLSLKGPEVKSLRNGKGTLEGSFGRIEGEEIWLYGFHIAPYAFATIEPPDPSRKRKLLLHRQEIKKIMGHLTLKGHTLIPLEVYFNQKGWAKVLLGLAAPKKGPDRREEIKKRDLEREMAKQIKGKFRA